MHISLQRNIKNIRQAEIASLCSKLKLGKSALSFVNGRPWRRFSCWDSVWHTFWVSEKAHIVVYLRPLGERAEAKMISPVNYLSYLSYSISWLQMKKNWDSHPLYSHYIPIIFPLYFHYISIIFPLYIYYVHIITYFNVYIYMSQPTLETQRDQSDLKRCHAQRGDLAADEEPGRCSCPWRIFFLDVLVSLAPKIP